jgi:hypothetical protein
MANYLIVVPRGNAELFDLLSVAFRGHTGFNVVVDRRGTDSPRAQNPSTLQDPAERRGGREALGPDEIVVAERSDRADRAPMGAAASRSLPRILVRRRRARRSGSGPERAQPPSGSGSGAATVC